MKGLLLDEVLHFHTSLFSRPPSQDLAAAYVRAHGDIAALADMNSAQRQSLRRIIQRRLDAVAIEFWLRSKDGSRHPLSAKLLLISYLAETDACHPEYRRSGIARGGLCAMSVQVLRSAVRMVCGLFQKGRHGIV